MDHCKHDHPHNHSQPHHEHSHSLGGGHAPKTFGKAFAIGIFLNLGFVLAEAGYGYASNSLALMADAGHNFSDVVGLALAWFAIWLGTRKPSKLYTFGLGQTSILAAFFNALLLLVAVGGILWEAVVRFQHPQPVIGSAVIYVAAVGILINAGTAFMFMSGKNSDINIRGAYLHMAADALVSAGVVIAGFVIKSTGWLWLDPAVSVVISIVILFGTWNLLKESFNLSIAAVPTSIAQLKIKEFLENLKGVKSVHDFHVWAISTTENALTAHLVMPDGHPGDLFLREASHELDHHFQIHHSTFQIELGNDQIACPYESDEVI